MVLWYLYCLFLHFNNIPSSLTFLPKELLIVKSFCIQVVLYSRNDCCSLFSFTFYFMPVLIKQYLYLWPSLEGYWWRGSLCPTSPLFSPNSLDSFNPGFTCFSLMDSFLPSLVFRVACCWALRCTLATAGQGRGCSQCYSFLGEHLKTSHSHILSWRIPWTEEPGGLQSIELDMTEVI